MKGKTRQDKAWLLAIAKAVAARLEPQRRGTPLRIRMPSRAVSTDTDGWRAVIGDLGNSRPRLEVWFDRFTGYPERKLYAGFKSNSREPILAITKRVSRNLWPTRVITPNDTDYDKFMILCKRLGRSEFNTPILEKYKGGFTYFGVYDPTRATVDRLNPQFCNRAVAFFDDVIHALPAVTAEDQQHDVYPQRENRQQVVSHLQRERSRLLVAERKILDNFECQVCGMRFDKLYGSLGQDFAEAHHVIPLSHLRGQVKTSIDNLRTVCANCHRMLHRMNGKRGDIARLRAIVRRHRG